MKKSLFQKLTTTFVISAGTLLAASPSAHGVLTSFTNRAAFETAAGAVTSEDFNGFTAPISPTPTALFTDFNIISTLDFPIIPNALALQLGSHVANVNGTNFIEYRTVNGLQRVGVIFPAGAFAFGFDWRNSDSNDDHMVFVADGTSFDLGGPGSGFFGVTSDVAITAPFEFSSTPGGTGLELVFGGLDNFTYNLAANNPPPPSGGDGVPEPITATLGLMGLGVLGMATRRRVA